MNRQCSQIMRLDVPRRTDRRRTAKWLDDTCRTQQMRVGPEPRTATAASALQGFSARIKRGSFHHRSNLDPLWQGGQIRLLLQLWQRTGRNCHINKAASHSIYLNDGVQVHATVKPHPCVFFFGREFNGRIECWHLDLNENNLLTSVRQWNAFSTLSQQDIIKHRADFFGGSLQIV